MSDPIHLAPDEVEVAVALRKKGYSYVSIGGLFNVSESVIRRTLTEKGVDKPRSHNKPTMPIYMAYNRLVGGNVERRADDGSVISWTQQQDFERASVLPMVYRSPQFDPESKKNVEEKAMPIMCGDCKHWKAIKPRRNDPLDVPLGKCERHNSVTSRLMACSRGVQSGYTYCVYASAELIKGGLNPTTMSPFVDGVEKQEWINWVNKKKETIRAAVDDVLAVNRERNKAWEQTQKMLREALGIKAPEKEYSCDPVAVKARDYYYKNREKILERKRSYRAEHREEVNRKSLEGYHRRKRAR